MQRFGGVVIAKLGGDDLPLGVIFLDFGLRLFHPLVLVGDGGAGVEERHFSVRFGDLLARHLNQQAAQLFRRPLVDVDAAALRFGVRIPGQNLDAALHRALERRTQPIRRHGGDDDGVIALVDEVIDELHLAGDARLGRTVVGYVHAEIFPRLFRAVAAAGEEPHAHQLRDKGNAVRRLRRGEAEGHCQDYQFCFHLTLRIVF